MYWARQRALTRIGRPLAAHLEPDFGGVRRKVWADGAAERGLEDVVELGLVDSLVALWTMPHETGTPVHSKG